MTLKKMLYCTRVDITDSWKKAFMMRSLLRIVFISLLAAQATPNTVWAQVKAVPPLSGVIGKVQSFAKRVLLGKRMKCGLCESRSE
jgi:hypothetical protein